MQFQRLLEAILGDPESGREGNARWSGKAMVVTGMIVLGALLVVLFLLAR